MVMTTSLSASFVEEVRLLGNVTVISGYWSSAASSPYQAHYKYRDERYHLSATQFNQGFNTLYLPGPVPVATKYGTVPKWNQWTATQSATFAFHPIILRDDQVLVSPTRVTDESIRQAWTSSKHVITMIGASHMRYNFDAIMQYLFNNSVLDSYRRKHEDIVYGNLHGLTHVDNLQHIYADDQSDLLLSLCQAWSAEPPSTAPSRTIILQTGSWDVTLMPLRRLLRFKQAASRLIDTIRAILLNQVSCGSLQHIVFLTTVPRTLCFDDSSDCFIASHPEHRKSSSLLAASFNYVASLLRGLHQTQAKSSIALSIVDAFSIIQSRLIFSRRDEMICHYLCRMPAKTDLDNAPLVLVHTKGGDAVVEALLLAVTLKDVGYNTS